MHGNRLEDQFMRLLCTPRQFAVPWKHSQTANNRLKFWVDRVGCIAISFSWITSAGAPRVVCLRIINADYDRLACNYKAIIRLCAYWFIHWRDERSHESPSYKGMTCKHCAHWTAKVVRISSDNFTSSAIEILILVLWKEAFHIKMARLSAALLSFLRIHAQPSMNTHKQK